MYASTTHLRKGAPRPHYNNNCYYFNIVVVMMLSPDHFTLSQAQATHLLASMCTFVKDNTARKEVSV